jgi:hypothetical protein
VEIQSRGKRQSRVKEARTPENPCSEETKDLNQGMIRVTAMFGDGVLGGVDGTKWRTGFVSSVILESGL